MTHSVKTKSRRSKNPVKRSELDSAIRQFHTVGMQLKLLHSSDGVGDISIFYLSKLVMAFSFLLPPDFPNLWKLSPFSPICENLLGLLFRGKGEKKKRVLFVEKGPLRRKKVAAKIEWKREKTWIAPLSLSSWAAGIFSWFLHFRSLGHNCVSRAPVTQKRERMELSKWFYLRGNFGNKNGQ